MPTSMPTSPTDGIMMGFYALPELGQPITTTETTVKGRKLLKAQLIMQRSKRR